MSTETKDEPDTHEGHEDDNDDCPCGHCKTIVPLCMELAVVVNTWKERGVDPALTMKVLVRFMSAMTVSMAMSGREALGGLEVVSMIARQIGQMADSQQQKMLQGLLGALVMEMTPNVPKGKAN